MSRFTRLIAAHWVGTPLLSGQYGGEPIPIDTYCCDAPGIWQVLFHQGEIGEKIFSPADKRVFAKCQESILYRAGKIPVRNCGIPLSVPFEEARDIAPIFAKQGPGLVLEVALEEHKGASCFLDKGVDPGLLRDREDSVTVGGEFVLVQIIEARMRDREPVRDSCGQWMARNITELENT